MKTENYTLDDILTILEENSARISHYFGVDGLFECDIKDDSLELKYEFTDEDKHLVVEVRDGHLKATIETFEYDHYRDPFPGPVLSNIEDATDDFESCIDELHVLKEHLDRYFAEKDN